MSSSADTTDIAACANCNKSESDDINLKRCTACKMVKYCSRDCQIAHRPKHKKECNRRAAELFDQELFKDPPEGPECPICMLPLPYERSNIDFYACCGKTICLGCVYAQIKEEFQSGKRPEDCGACPFCRTPPTCTDKEEIERLIAGVERNDADSMRKLAIYYTKGEMGLQKGSKEAMELFQKAGEHGCASSYGSLGNIYCESFEKFQCEGTEKDVKKAKHYWALAAIGGCMGSRHNLGCLEERNGNRTRAGKHFLICAKAGYETSLQSVKLSFQQGYIAKDEYAEALGAYHKQHNDRRSAMRDESAQFFANDS